MKYIKKILIILSLPLLIAAIYFAGINGFLAPVLEKIYSETPEDKISAYLKAASLENNNAVSDIWKINAENKDMEKRRSTVTSSLASGQLLPFFNVKDIEWWSMCCMSEIRTTRMGACFARVKTQIFTKNGQGLDYIFDMQNQGGCEEWHWNLSNETFHFRRWEIIEAYPAREQSLYHPNLGHTFDF